MNDAILNDEQVYDVSIARQKGTINIINDNIKSLLSLCQNSNREMPTEIKLTYDIADNKLNADYRYDLIFSNSKSKTAYDVLEEWYHLEEDRNK